MDTIKKDAIQWIHPFVAIMVLLWLSPKRHS